MEREMVAQFATASISSALDVNPLKGTKYVELIADFEELMSLKKGTRAYRTFLIDFKNKYNDPETNNPELYNNLIKSHDLLEKYLDNLIKYLEEIKKDTVLSPFLPDIVILNGEILLLYKNKNYDEIVSDLFSEFNKKIFDINTKLMINNSVSEEKNALVEKKLTLIADLYQTLEWIHPFTDGQGRTDLILLSKLLSENGFNPAILIEPYFSSFAPLELWVQYLKEGMQLWRDLEKTPEK